MTALTIVAYGRPITQGSKTKGRYGNIRDSNAETLKPWRDNVRSAALDQIGPHPDRFCDKVCTCWVRLDGPVTVSVVFTFDRPRTHYRTGKNAHLLRDDAPTSPANVKSGDIDKLQRAAFDALTDAGVWKDDCQVVHVEADKVYVGSCSIALDRPGISITVRATS